MSEMDLDFDGPSKVPTRQARFAPKNSKIKSQPETKPKIEMLPSTDSAISTKKEELASQPPLKDHEAENGVATAKEDVLLDGETRRNDDLEEEQGAMETDNDQDEIVREIDVWFTPSVDPSNQLFVFQYPLRPVWRPYELEERCQEVRLRPSTAQMEVDLAIDFDSKNFDRDSVHAETMKKQTLSTSWMPLSTCASSAVGVLIGDKLHLNPVHAVVQLRPSLQHHKESELMKNITTSNDEKSVENKDVKEKKPVGPSKKQNKPPGNYKDIEEPWLHLKYHGARSDISTRYLQKMAIEEGSPVPFSMSPVDYLSAYCLGRPTDTDRLKTLRTRLSQLPLEERVRTWLLEGPPIHRFDVLKYLAPDNPVDEILRVLQIYAQLVQGLWVPKSSLVYGTTNGVEVLARNFVLFEFTKSTIIKKSVFDRTILQNATKALNSLAVERPDLNDWKLREHPDKNFENLYGDVVREQQAIWECVGKQINDILPGRRNRPTIKNPLNPRANIPALPRGDKPTPSSLLRTSMSEEIREALPKALQNVFRIHKVCSLQQISLGLRTMAVSKAFPQKGDSKKVVTAAMGVSDASQEEIEAMISQFVVNIHGVYVLKSSPDNPQYDALRKVVIDLFMAEGPSAKLKKASIIEAAKLQLGRDITSVEFQKVMKELCRTENSAWVLRSGDGNPTQ